MKNKLIISFTFVCLFCVTFPISSFNQDIEEKHYCIFISKAIDVFIDTNSFFVTTEGEYTKPYNSINKEEVYITNRIWHQDRLVNLDNSFFYEHEKNWKNELKEHNICILNFKSRYKIDDFNCINFNIIDDFSRWWRDNMNNYVHRLHFSNVLYDENDNALLYAIYHTNNNTLINLFFVFKKDANNNWELFSYRFFIKG